MNAAVELDTVSKVYRRYGPSRRIGTLKSALLGGKLINAAPSETLQAVDEVSLRIPQGAAFGIVGCNGSGKSTLLKLMAGITRPTSGSVRVQGRVSALIELGAGFHPEISGRENVFINGVMLGLTRREIARRFDEIVEFADVADFIDAPVRTYSSGMYMRLGFAVAVHVDADVLLVDEVLAVGDERFSLKCLDKFAEYKRHGKTTVLVTHGLDMVERFCDEALWLDAGKVRTSGDPRRVLHAYIGDVETEEEHELARADQKARKAVEPAGDGRVNQDAPAGEPERRRSGPRLRPRRRKSRRRRSRSQKSRRRRTTGPRTCSRRPRAAGAMDPCGSTMCVSRMTRGRGICSSPAPGWQSACA